jgi:hypothetical protein
MPREIPRYLALARLVLEPGWIEVKAGSEFYHEGPPSNGMLALNAAAKKAKLASISPRWREKRQTEIFRLARSFGFSHGTDAEAAAHIEKFIQETESQKETSS